MKGRKVSNSEGTETTGDWKEHWRDAGDRMREMREENVGLAERDGKAVSQSCQGLLALLMSSGGERRQTQPTLRLATSASDIILSEKARSFRSCRFWLTSLAFAVCVLAPIRLASASLLAVSQGFTPLFYLPGCARDFH